MPVIMGAMGPKSLILSELHNRDYEREVDHRFSDDHLKQDVLSNAPFLVQQKVNYAIYHEPRLIYIMHVPAKLSLEEQLSKQREGKLESFSGIERSEILFKKLSGYRRYSSPLELRKILEEEYGERNRNPHLELNKALIIENLARFPEQFIYEDRHGKEVTALGKALEETGYINIKQILITLTGKTALDPARLAVPAAQADQTRLSDLAKREMHQNKIYELLVFSDPYHGKKLD